MRLKLTKTVMVLTGAFLLLCVALPEAKGQNLIINGDFSAGLEGWTVMPAQTPDWPLVNGAVNLHPPSGSPPDGNSGTIIPGST